MRSQLLFGFLIVLAACEGTRTGNPIGDDDSAMHPDAGKDPDETTNTGNGGITGDFGGPNCKATPSALDAVDQDTPLGFSAADVLAYASGVHETKIRWQSDGIGSSAPESGEHDLTIRIEPTSAKPRFVAYEEVENTGDSAGPAIDFATAGCQSFNAIEIDVTLAIESDGGALDETLQGTLRAKKVGWASVQIAVDAKDLNGSFHVVDPKVGNLMFVLSRLQLGLGVSPLGVRGNVTGEFMSEEPSNPSGERPSSAGSTSTAAGGGSIAEIGDSAECDPDGLSVGVDQKVEQFTAQDAIDLVNAASPLALAWQNGTKTTLELEFTRDRSAVCAVVEPNTLLTASDSGFIRLRGTLSVSSGDDRIDADWPVVVEAHPTTPAGTLGNVSVVLVSPNLAQAPIEDLAAEYGVNGIEASGYDGANIMFSLQFVAGATRDLAGMLTVSGLTQPMCPPPSSDPQMGTPGCRGIDLTTLDSATLAVP